MESEPTRYAGGDDELSRQREKHTSAFLGARHSPGGTDRTAEAVIGTVVEFPVPQRSGAEEVETFDCQPNEGPAFDGPAARLSEVLGMPATEEQALNSARRIQVLQRLQAMLLPE